MSAHSTERSKQGTTSNSTATGWMKLLRSTGGEQDTATQEAHASSDTSNQTPTATGASKKRQSSTSWNTAQKIEDERKETSNQGNTYLPTSTRVRQTRRKTKQLTTRQKKKLSQHHYQDQKNPTRRSKTEKKNKYSTQEEIRKRTEDQKPTKHKKNPHSRGPGGFK